MADGRGGQRGGTASTGTSARRSECQSWGWQLTARGRTMVTASNIGRHERENEELLRRVDHARRQDSWRCGFEQDRRVVAEVLQETAVSTVSVKRGVWPIHPIRQNDNPSGAHHPTRRRVSKHAVENSGVELNDSLR